MAHWHDFNPWADRLIYLPDMQELSACVDPFKPEDFYSRVFREHGYKVDAYILPKSLEVGVRYGKEGSEYYSPYVNQWIAKLLVSKYSN